MIYNNSKYNNDWDIKTLNQLGKFARGKSKHRPRNDQQLFNNGKYPLVQTGEITAANLYIRNHSAMYNEFGLKQSKLWDKETLCITIAANIAETALLGYPMCFPDSIVGFNAYPNESSELFMHYVFTFIKKSIQNSASGSIQDNINIDYLTSLKFRIPPKKYQDSVAKILSSLDSKIELNNKINAELEAMAKTLYDYWFVQFDFPDKNSKPYKSSGGKMVWSEELKRDIPEGWQVKLLFDEMDVQYGFPFDTTKFTDDSTQKPVIRIRDIVENTISIYSIEDVNEKYKLKSGDLLIGMDGNFHLNFWDKDDAYLNQRSVRIRPKENSKVSNFQALFQLRPYIKSKEKNVSRTTVGHLSDKDLKALFVLITGDKFDTRSAFDSMLSKIISNRLQNQQLAELRDWLLPMLMNGQVKVGALGTVEKLDVVTEPNINNESEAYEKRKAIALYIIAQSKNDLSFGKVKFEKLLHLSDFHIVKSNLEQVYKQRAAGPLDDRFTYAFWNEIEKEGLIKFEKRGKLERICYLGTTEQAIDAMNHYFSQDIISKIEVLVQTFFGSNYEKTEIISTLYAVWNNRIIKNEMITDELLKKDFLNWDKQKAKYKNALDNNLTWMREKDIIPDGWGKVIEKVQ